ncbi:hypothetical protein KPH14_010130 [Odynerus spinipes]|uniref:Eukaryotic translation initiation factor 4E transporter n=1 Tax=Odynerus spinipes TaxID=1348599 RepID=A0AAD9RT56_9HYME|nr:hypothetical protein KPH14_010130 [Odynerus spinipes]
MSLESVTSDKQLLNQKTTGDDAIISMSVAGEVTDTSIMEVGRSRPQFQYSREELMVIKSLPLSKRRPDFLDTSYNNTRGVWDPERWHSNRKRSDTPPKDERGIRSEPITENHNKRRNGDPRERIRKEQDGIVLSPQRRSFNSGCFVNVNQPPNRRSESPIGKTEVSHRETVRRIGSGRILTRDIWDFRSENEKLEPERTDFSFRSGTSAGNSLRDRDNRESRETKDRENIRDRERDRDNLRDRDERNDRFERRSFGRDFGDRDRDRDRDRGMDRAERNHQNDRDKERGRERRFSNDRRKSCSDNREADEPEWFSSGPTSQHDTIELRGFEDIPEEKVVSNSANIKNKKLTPAQKKRGKRNSLEKDEKPNENTSGPKGRSTPTTLDQSINAVPAPHSPISEQNEPPSDSQKESQDTNESIMTETSSEPVENSSAHKNEETSHPDFNLDDFLKSDTFPGVPGLLTNGVGSNGGSCSRFSQWFKRESPVQQQTDSRRASIQDELLNNLLNDITEPNIQIPSVTESNTYFAPISPANPTTNNSTSTTGVKLLEMLQRGNKQQHNHNGQGDLTTPVIPLMKNSSIKDMEVGGKVVHSLEELEARMRGGVPPPTSNSELSRVNKTEEDLSAFKKLLAQVTGGQAVPAANGPMPQKPQSVTLMQLLNSQLKTPQQPVVPQQPVADQIHASTFNHVGPIAPTQHPHQVQMQHENLMKVLHIQQQQQKQRQQHSDMLSMIMSGQRLMGVSPVQSEMQMMMNNTATSGQELLQRPEAQAIIQGLQQGEITKQHLIQQLQNPAMQHRHREVLVNILKMYGGTTPRAISPHPSAPTPQDHILHQMLYQQQQQQQQQPRIPSPMNNVIPHRVPSPRELVMHTQSIMQNALIKKKLEEQRENFRKRQDQQQQQQVQQRPSTPVNSPAKQTMSPTPLAFTPTSVLRKMTADKEPEGNSNDLAKLANQNQVQQMQSAVQLLTQGVLSRHNTLRPQSVQSSWSSSNMKQYPGRPIVKGGGGGNSVNQYQYSGNLDFQQQQHRTMTNVYGNPTRSKHAMTPTVSSHPNVPQYNVTQNTIMNQRSNHINPQMKQVQQVQSHIANVQHQQQQQQPQQSRSANPQMQLMLNQNYNSNRTDGRMMRSQQLNINVGRQNSPGLGFMSSNSGELSPTSNQLARWFTPELLAQARAGKLPELGQTNVLSLEELERLQHASTKRVRKL